LKQQQSQVVSSMNSIIHLSLSLTFHCLKSSQQKSF